MNEQLITITLRTRSALHLGSGEGNNVTDALLRRDAQGRLFIPGSSIAGALRAIATRIAPRLDQKPCQAILEEFNSAEPCGCSVCRLFGDINPQEQDDKRIHSQEGGFASSLWIYDAQVAQQTTSIRDGVGIDRSSGAAARQGSVKFDLELLPANVTLKVKIKLTPTGDLAIDEYNVRLLSVVLAEWKAGRAALGGRVARGLGSFEVKVIEWQEHDLHNGDNLMKFLKREAGDWQKTSHDLEQHIADLRQTQTVQPWVGNERLTNLTDYAVARNWIEAVLTLQFAGPMLINDLAISKRGGFDHAPLSALSTGSAWVLPGSSFRGVLRSQAERIARTIATQHAVAQNDPRSYFLVHNPAGDPNMRRALEPLANSDALLTHAGIDGEARVKPGHLDLADQLFGSVRMGSRLIVEDGELLPPVALKAMDFLAIDRFTGGGRDSAKFDAVALWQPRFKVRLRLDNPTLWELGWLLLTLRDLHEGLATVGFGGAKGFGRLTIHKAKLRLGYLDASDFPSDKTNISAFSTQQINAESLWSVVAADWSPGNVSSLWLALGEEWVMALNQKIKTFERKQQVDLQKKIGVPLQSDDSYFTADGILAALYPIILPGGRKA